MIETFDCIVIGGGIVGISTAMQIKRHRPQCSILLIEKEHKLAQHQTGHNSGVIHAGVYYQPGSLKAEFCKRGAEATMEFCRQHNIAFRQPGKLLVATNPLELQRLGELEQRCGANGIEVELIDQRQLLALEPHITGLAALRVATSGIVDYRQVVEAMRREFLALGGQLRVGCALQAAREYQDRVELHTSRGTLSAKLAIGCGGLMADRLCDLFGIARDFAIIPFRGEYYQLTPEKLGLVQHLIYPIPDPALPFLGVHLTPMIDGNLTVGPNALLGWRREGYRSRGNISWRDSAEMLSFSGFWPLMRNNLKAGLTELANGWSKPLYLKRVQKFCPSLQLSDLQPYPAGVRAQAVSRSGELIHDFLFAESRRSLQVCNAPSPAATSALPIGEHIGERACRRLAELSGN